jgi:hypothetical protein
LHFPLPLQSLRPITIIITTIIEQYIAHLGSVAVTSLQQEHKACLGVALRWRTSLVFVVHKAGIFG